MTVRVADVAPGELAEVDFGRMGRVPDLAAGRLRLVHALIVTLVHSRHQYVHVCGSQKLPDLIEGLERAWEFFGGVPARVVLDNLRPAVTRADRYEPIFQRTFAEYADYRGFVIDAAVLLFEASAAARQTRYPSDAHPLAVGRSQGRERLQTWGGGGG